MPTIGHSFTILKTVDSTNNYAMAQVHAGSALHGNAYFTVNQTGGKGQRGKTWHSAEGLNMALSLVIEPRRLLLSQQFLLSVSIALACYNLVKECAGSDTCIKWPNDIYWRDRKAGGILIENVVRGTVWQFAIAGIGLNVNQTEYSSLTNPVSLKQITGKTHDPAQLAKELCTNADAKFNQLCNGEQEVLLDEYRSVLYKRNELVKLKRNSAVFETRIKGVSRQGRLITENQVEQEFDAGEVEWLQ